MSAGVQSQGWGRDLEPGLRKIFIETYNEKKPQWSDYLNVLTSKKAIETDARVGLFSEWNTKGTKDSTEYEDPTDLETVLYKHRTFSKGFQIEKEQVDDEQYNLINKMPKGLARAARSTIESRTIEVLNNAWVASASNFKGEALISDSHVRLDGGASDNLIGTLTLSEANLEIGMKLAREQVDERGLQIMMNPDILIVGKSNEFVAEKIVKSIQLPGTNNNDINPMKGRFKVIVLDYLTDDGRWFLLDSTLHQLNFFWREKLNFKGQNIDFDTDVAKYKGRMRFSYGWTDHRGVLGAKP